MSPTFPAAPPGASPHAALPGSGRAEFGQAASSAMSMKWAALHDAAAVIATLAGLATEPLRAEVRNYPAVMRDAGGWRRARAEQGIEDLTAVMTPGLAALLAIHARGANPAPAALALWQEFHAARAALLALLPPAESTGPARLM